MAKKYIVIVMRQAFRFLAKTSALLFFVISSCFLIIHGGAKNHIYTDVARLPFAQAVLIPGASVSSRGALSLVLKDRADTAVAAYREGKAEKILVSGDNGSRAYNEVDPVRAYLLDRGVPDKDIFLDYAGFDTYSSMYRARDIFRADSIIVATQSFHLSRAVYIGRRLGIETSGISADKRPYLPRNSVREAFANVKTMMSLFFHVKPKYLGEQIPLSGVRSDELRATSSDEMTNIPPGHTM